MAAAVMLGHCRLLDLKSLSMSAFINLPSSTQCPKSFGAPLQGDGRLTAPGKRHNSRSEWPAGFNGQARHCKRRLSRRLLKQRVSSQNVRFPHSEPEGALPTQPQTRAFLFVKKMPEGSWLGPEILRRPLHISAKVSRGMPRPARIE